MKPTTRKLIRKRREWRKRAEAAFGAFVVARKACEPANGVAVDQAASKIRQWFGRRAERVITTIQRRALCKLQ